MLPVVGALVKLADLDAILSSQELRHLPSSLQILLACFGVLPVVGALVKQLIKGSAGPKREFGPESYSQEFLPRGAAATSRADRKF